MALALTFLQGASDVSDTNPYTFAAQNLGAAAADRYIVVCVQSRIAAIAISSVSVGGVAATQVATATNGGTTDNIAAIYIAAVPTGTTGDVVVTLNQSGLRCVVQLYRMTGAASAVASDTKTSTADNPTASLTVPSGGAAVGCAITQATATATWAGLTEDYDAQTEAIAATSASLSGSGGGSVTCTATYSAAANSAGVFASWAPAAAAVGSMFWYESFGRPVCHV